jgi:ArsR family transcriptional regulator
MKTGRLESKASKILSVLSNPFRIRILFAIGKGEACVCHLEAVLKNRQAYISQHLMALRKAGVLNTRREGKYIYYRLADEGTLDLIRSAGKLAGLDEEQLPKTEGVEFSPSCCCPNCHKGSQVLSSTAIVSNVGEISIKD